MQRAFPKAFDLGLYVLVFLSVGASPAYAQLQSFRERTATGESVSFEHDGLDREYRIHVPKSYSSPRAAPLFVFLHGGGGDSVQGSKMGLTPIADKHGFIVVYPSAVNKNWNDGRELQKRSERDRKIDDVAFIAAVVNRVKKDHSIDSDSVFCAGISNGGFMTQRMAIEKPQLFAAAGIFVASMGKTLKEKFDPKLPMSMVFINGTEDPLVPYGGGEVQVDLFPKLTRLRGKSVESRGICVATEEVVEMWVERNGITSEPTVTDLPNKSTSDDSQVEFRLWKGGKHGTAVALYKVIGGGHTVPGGMQYLPQRLIGRVNRDIEGFETMWQFFRGYARK